MKTITTLIGLALLSGVAMASSTLNLALNGGNSYTVYLDGEQYQTSSTIRFLDLFPGRHTLSVIQKNNYTSSSLYNGFIDIEDGQELFGTITNGNLTISTSNNGSFYTPYPNDYNNQYDNSNYGNMPNGNHYNYGMSRYVFNQLRNDFRHSTDSRKARMLVQRAQRHGITSNQAKHLLQKFSFDSHRLNAAKQITNSVVDIENYFIVGETFVFDSNKRNFLRHINRNGAYNNGGNGTCSPRPNYPRPNNSYGMNHQAFQVLQNAVRKESFDNNRKQVVLTAIKNGRISSQQMTQLLRAFTFDNNRLETAKAAIPYISDKGNYWMAGETFTFSNNKQAFLNAL
ncbi:MAG: DUF4476 domain-containing protein [Flavobacteriales bacterium]|jgi:hypothetical protein|nr:DUF4476 domain-containing protein [Flavobacteriales bacterium]